MNVVYMLLLDFEVKSVEQQGVVGSRCLAGRGRECDGFRSRVVTGAGAGWQIITLEKPAPVARV
jgi:hypothetical protein